MDKTLPPLPPVGRITLMPVFLVLLLLVLLNEKSAHCASLNAEAAVPSCNPGEIPLKAHVKEPGCYALAHLHQECYSSRQCIDQDTFCGFYNHHHHHLPINATLQPFNKEEKTVCICRDGTKEVGGRCEVLHHCSIGHFNRDYHQADCPHASQYCTGYRCFCKAGYTQVEDGCLPEEVEEAVVEEMEKEKGEEMTSTEKASSEEDKELTAMIELIDSLPPPPAANPLYTLDPVALVSLLLLALIIGTLLLAFVCYLPLVVFGKIKSRYSKVEEGLV